MDKRSANAIGCTMVVESLPELRAVFLAGGDLLPVELPYAGVLEGVTLKIEVLLTSGDPCVPNVHP